MQGINLVTRLGWETRVAHPGGVAAEAWNGLRDAARELGITRVCQVPIAARFGKSSAARSLTPGRIFNTTQNASARAFPFVRGVRLPPSRPKGASARLAVALAEAVRRTARNPAKAGHQRTTGNRKPL